MRVVVVGGQKIDLGDGIKVTPVEASYTKLDEVFQHRHDLLLWDMDIFGSSYETRLSDGQSNIVYWLLSRGGFFNPELLSSFFTIKTDSARHFMEGCGLEDRILDANPIQDMHIPYMMENPGSKYVGNFGEDRLFINGKFALVRDGEEISLDYDVGRVLSSLMRFKEVTLEELEAISGVTDALAHLFSQPYQVSLNGDKICLLDRPGDHSKLTRKEAEVFQGLYENHLKGRIMPHREFTCDPYFYVHRLRRYGIPIENVHGEGYRLNL